MKISNVQKSIGNKGIIVIFPDKWPFGPTGIFLVDVAIFIAKNLF